LIPAIVLVTHREHTSAFHLGLEEFAVAVWATDPGDKVALGGVLSPSIGLAQIKPRTAFTALALVRNASSLFVQPGACRADAPADLPAKEWTTCPRSHETLFDRFAYPAVGRIPLSPSQPQSGFEMSHGVAVLLEDQASLENAAFLLDLYATQWESADPGWSIRSRPEILATLFQIGFERSFPKPNPQPNEFGLKVAAAMSEPWVIENF
jgi:hypothetical protein